jgi:hypothetical protein
LEDFIGKCLATNSPISALELGMNFVEMGKEEKVVPKLMNDFSFHVKERLLFMSLYLLNVTTFAPTVHRNVDQIFQRHLLKRTDVIIYKNIIA